MAKRPSRKTKSILDDQIFVNNHIFLGRVEEQNEFRRVLNEMLHPPEEETLPYVILLYGDGGMGKTTLARRFFDIALGEEPFAGVFQFLWIDWEDERRHIVGLQTDRNRIAPETVLDALHSTVAREGFARHFDKYQKTIKLRREAEKQAAQTLTGVGERNVVGGLASLGAEALGKIVRLTAPIVGDTGEKAVKIVSEYGIKIAADEALNAVDILKTRLRARLKPELYEIYLNPQEQLAHALGEGFKHFTEEGYILSGKPLIITLDTYEIVDHVDLWVRSVMRAGGRGVLWIICGRDNLTRSRQFGDDYFKGYAEEWPRRLASYDLRQLALDDVKKYFALAAPDYPINKTEAEIISQVTRGIPLAIREAAEMRQQGTAIEEIVSGIDYSTPAEEIVGKMTSRYLLHALKNDEDRRALYAMALARGDRDVLRAMLRPDAAANFDLNFRLRQLERDYASVHFKEARLQDEPAFFFREHLKVMRDEDWVKELNRRAADTLRARLKKREEELPRAGDRCDDEDWANDAIQLTDHLFWLDESEAWRWLVPQFVESQAYSSKLLYGLLSSADAVASRLPDQLLPLFNADHGLTQPVLLKQWPTNLRSQIELLNRTVL